MTKKKKTAIEEFVDGIKKASGGQMISGEDAVILGWVTTGSLLLDYGIRGEIPGGWPSGRIVEIMGATSEGKSTVIYCGLKYAQQQGGMAVLFDAECAYDKDYGTALGIDNSKLLYEVPESAEAMFARIEQLADHWKKAYPEQDVPMVIGVDSIASLVPSQVKEKEIGESKRPTDLAMCLSMNLPRVNLKIAQTNICIIGANQLREKPGMAYQGGGEYAPGGRSWGFYSSIRLRIRRKEWIGDKDDPQGIVSEVTVMKNRVGRPNSKAKMYLYYGSGVADVYSWFDFLVTRGIITRAGSWYSVAGPDGDEKKWQGFNGYAELVSDPEWYKHFYGLMVRAMSEHGLDRVIDLPSKQAVPLQQALSDGLDISPDDYGITEEDLEDLRAGRAEVSIKQEE